MAEEAADIAGWAYVLWVRLLRVQRRYQDQELLVKIRRAAFRGGASDWERVAMIRGLLGGSRTGPARPVDSAQRHWLSTGADSSFPK